MTVGTSHRVLAGPLTMYKQDRCASHRPSGTALPLPHLGPQLFIHLTAAAALPSADFCRRTGLKKGSSVRPSPLVSDLFLSHPRQSNRQTEAISPPCATRIAALVTRVAGAGVPMPMCELLVVFMRWFVHVVVGGRRGPLPETTARCRLQVAVRCGPGPLACMPVSPLKRAGSGPDEMQGAPAEQPQISSANYASQGLKRVS